MTLLDKIIHKYGFENWRTIFIAKLYQILKGEKTK